MNKEYLQELSTSEITSNYGGNVPMSWYMCDETIDANISFAKGFIKGLWESFDLY